MPRKRPSTQKDGLRPKVLRLAVTQVPSDNSTAAAPVDLRVPSVVNRSNASLLASRNLQITEDQYLRAEALLCSAGAFLVKVFAVDEDYREQNPYGLGQHSTDPVTAVLIYLSSRFAYHAGLKGTENIAPSYGLSRRSIQRIVARVKNVLESKAKKQLQQLETTLHEYMTVNTGRDYELAKFLGCKEPMLDCLTAAIEQRGRATFPKIMRPADVAFLYLLSCLCGPDDAQHMGEIFGYSEQKTRAIVRDVSRLVAWHEGLAELKKWLDGRQKTEEDDDECAALLGCNGNLLSTLTSFIAKNNSEYDSLFLPASMRPASAALLYLDFYLCGLNDAACMGALYGCSREEVCTIAQDINRLVMHHKDWPRYKGLSRVIWLLEWRQQGAARQLRDGLDSAIRVCLDAVDTSDEVSDGSAPPSMINSVSCNSMGQLCVT
jgi:hypothetical protein